MVGDSIAIHKFGLNVIAKRGKLNKKLAANLWEVGDGNLFVLFFYVTGPFYPPPKRGRSKKMVDILFIFFMISYW